MPSLRHARLPPRAPSPGHPPRHLKHSAVRRFSPESEDGGCCCAGLTFAAYCGDRILSEVQDKWTDVLVWCAAAPSPQSSCPAHLALQLQCWREVSAVALSPPPRHSAPAPGTGSRPRSGRWRCWRCWPPAPSPCRSSSCWGIRCLPSLRPACNQIAHRICDKRSIKQPAAAAFSYLGCPFPVALSS